MKFIYDRDPYETLICRRMPRDYIKALVPCCSYWGGGTMPHLSSALLQIHIFHLLAQLFTLNSSRD